MNTETGSPAVFFIVITFYVKGIYSIFLHRSSTFKFILQVLFEIFLLFFISFFQRTRSYLYLWLMGQLILKINLEFLK